MIRIPFKPGADFKLPCTYKLLGIASSIAGKTIKAQVKTKSNGAIVATLDFAAAAGVGRFDLTKAAADTKAWPIGLLYADVRVVDDVTGFVTYSKTFCIETGIRITDE